MSSPNPKKQKAGRQVLEDLFVNRAHVWIIHYSCESFYDRLNGQSPRITSIAIRKLDSGQTRSFSIHQVAEQKKVAFEQIEQHYDLLELEMLNAFYDHVNSFQGMRYIHWNMRY
jgi:hypothetical protein